MADNISSGVLFHFTNSLSKLRGILRAGFLPRFCPEYTLQPLDVEAARINRPPMFALPMVCFCDLPLSLIGKHLDEYGRFGIGLSKTWGIRNGVSPVIYTHSRARTHRLLTRISRRALTDGLRSIRPDLAAVSAYSKPFRGPAWRNDRVKKRVTFYDEREWRYVALAKGRTLMKQYWFARRNEPKFRRSTRRVERKLKPLRFLPGDIEYIILPADPTEDNIVEMHDYILRLYAGRYGRREAVLVTTAIMSDDCIADDI